jgi:phosphorylcholine metabolism protein LicD
MNKIDIIKKSFEKGNKFHNIIYPIFMELVNFFEVNGINYYLCGGTLLGCIRDNKRIGWDDDYDIFIYTREINKLEKFKLPLNNIITDKNVIYHFKINEISYILNIHESNFWQIWQVNKDGIPVNKITDIFNENDDWYKNISKPKGPSLKKLFESIYCNVPSNYEEQLNYFYKNYRSEYVLSNHGLNSCYRDNERDNNIIMDKDEYDLFVKKYGIKL